MPTWIKEKKLEPAVICKLLTEIVTVDNSGQVSFENAFFFEELKTALVGMLEFEKEIPSFRRQSLVWKALIEVSKKTKGKIEEAKLRNALNKECNTYLSLPKKKYYMLTSMSLNHRYDLSPTTWNRAKTTFPNRITKSDSEKLAENLKQSFDGSAGFPSQFKWVRIGISGRGSDEALENALFNFDLSRAIWNLRLNHRREMTSAERKPINKVLRGPITCVFSKEGLNIDHWWYEPDFDFKHTKPAAYQSKIDLNKYYSSVERLLRPHNLRPELTKLLVLLVRALDQRDPETCFNRLWSVLEIITGTNNHEEAVNRISSIYFDKDRDLVRQTLHPIRHTRNRLIHRGDELREARVQNYILKFHAEELIKVLLSTKFRFLDLAEFGQFLSLSRAHDLGRQVQLRQLAMRERS